MSWKFLAAAALAVGGFTAASARAGDLSHLALPAKNAPAQNLVLPADGDADLTDVHWHGGYRGRSYRPYYRGYGSYRYPARYYYPRIGVGIGLGYGYPGYYAPPAYYYAPPSYYCPPTYYAPISTGPGVTTYSLPEGNVNYSVTRPAAPGAERLTVPPLEVAPSGDGTYLYNGGPPRPVPMPRAEPDPTSAPHSSPIAPPAELKVSLPNQNKKESTTGKFVYPAYGDGPRRSSGSDPTIVVKDAKKSGR